MTDPIRNKGPGPLPPGSSIADEGPETMPAGSEVSPGDADAPVPPDNIVSSILDSLSAPAAHWAFSRPPEEGKPREYSAEVKETFFNHPALKTLAEINRHGIRNAADVEAFFDSILELNVQHEKAHEVIDGEINEGFLSRFFSVQFDTFDSGKAAASFQLAQFVWISCFDMGKIASLVESFRRHNIPYRVSDNLNISYTERNFVEWRGREGLPAKERGITIAKGASPFDLVHEMAHAVPADELLFLARFEDERAALALPDFPEESDSLAQIFIKLAGRQFRDEAYAGLAEIYLAGLFTRWDFEVPERRGRMYELMIERGIPGFIRDGIYLGDNHLILYNLATVTDLVEKIYEHPESIQDDLFRGMPHQLRMGHLDLNVMAWKRRLQAIRGELEKFLYGLYHDPQSDHPLKPVVNRIVPLLAQYLDIHLDRGSGETLSMPEIQVGERPFPRPAGDLSWIGENQEAAYETARMLSLYNDLVTTRLHQLIRNSVYSALVPISLMMPDADLERFWSSVLSVTYQYIEKAVARGALAEIDAYPILFPLALQGYFEQARDILPHVQSDPLFGELYVVSLFNGMADIAGVGEAAAVDFWIDILADEEKTGWDKRYVRAVKEIVGEGGVLKDQALRRLEMLFQKNNFVSSRDILELLFDMTTEELYQPFEKGATDNMVDEMKDSEGSIEDLAEAIREARENPKKFIAQPHDIDELEDPYDFAEFWKGTGHVEDNQGFFRSQYPGMAQVRQLAQAWQKLMDRGLHEQANRLAKVAQSVVRSVINFRTAWIKQDIEDLYYRRKKNYRLSDSFLQHVTKLDISETKLLPPASAVAAEIAAIISLPRELGGGWKTALKYLEGLPDGFVKTWACYRLSREMDHIAAPTNSELQKFLELWRISFETAQDAIPEDAFVQPDEEGIMFKGWRDPWLENTAYSRGATFLSGNERFIFAQQQYYAMLSAIPVGAKGKLAHRRKELLSQLETEEVKSVVLAPQLMPTLYDPHQYIEGVIQKKNKGLKQVYALHYDPNLIPLKVRIEDRSQNLTTDSIRWLAGRIDEILRTIPRSMQSSYIPLLVSLSAEAGKLGEETLQEELYEKAHHLASLVRRTGEGAFSRLFAYDGLDKKQKEFDVQARYRRYQATWERTALASLARIVVHAPPEKIDLYLDEIRRIIDNESIFDVMESADYAGAAAFLDATGIFPDLVYDLFHRAIQMRLREQYEAAYDVEHELALSIDSSHLSLEAKDKLLEQYVELSFVRIFRAYALGVARHHKREDMLMQAERLLNPLHALLDMVEQKGYAGAQRAIWQGIRRLTQEVIKELPEPLLPVALAVLARFIVVKHPELVHPLAQPALEDVARSHSAIEELEGILHSPYSRAQAEAYPDLPTAWDIRKAYADANDDAISGNFNKILSAMSPDNGSVDPYLLDLLNIDFMTNYSYRGDPESNFNNADRVPKILKHFGYAPTAFVKFAKEQPDIVRRVFLSHADPQSARVLSPALIKLIFRKDLPLEVRADAFRMLMRSGYLSDYIMSLFNAAYFSPESLQKFLDDSIYIFGRKIKHYSQSGRAVSPPPDWLLAPLFEPTLAQEREMILAALKGGPLLDEDDEPIKGINSDVINPYHVLFEAFGSPEAHNLDRYEDDEAYFIERLRDIVDYVVMQLYKVPSSDLLEHAPSVVRRKLEHEYRGGIARVDAFVESVVDVYKRNNILVRIGSVNIPEALERVHPVLRFVIADYISLVPASIRMFLLSALQHSQKHSGEDEVLGTFFEMTGQEKLAQFLSLQKGVVPKAYRQKLARFQEDLKPSTHQEIIDTLRRSGVMMGEDLTNGGVMGFEHAGTVGEIWKGSRVDGRPVAVKILPWKKRHRIQESLRVLKKLSAELQLFRQDLFGGIDFNDLYARYEETLLAEMDYRTEAQNLGELIPLMQTHGIAHPHIHEDLLHRDVMVMDYAASQNIADISTGAEKQSLIDTTGRWLAESIFKERIFYEDFHPGNVKWLPGENGEAGRPLVFDFGRIGRLDEGQRADLMEFLAAVSMGDVKGIASGLVSMSAKKGRVNKKGLRQAVAELLSQKNGGQTSSIVQELFSLASQFGADLQPNYLQFIKAVISWENLMQTIDPTADFSTYAAPVILEQLINGSGGTNGNGSPVSQPVGGSTPNTPAGNGTPATASGVFDGAYYYAAEDTTGFVDSAVSVSPGVLPAGFVDMEYVDAPAESANGGEIAGFIDFQDSQTAIGFAPSAAVTAGTQAVNGSMLYMNMNPAMTVTATSIPLVSAGAFMMPAPMPMAAVM